MNFTFYSSNLLMHLTEKDKAFILNNQQFKYLKGNKMIKLKYLLRL